MKPWIQTNTGHAAYPLALTPAMVSAQDIAHALSHLCRFTGHVNRFYSVAEHSVHVSYLVPVADALPALFHDAPEAYLGDVSAPIKAFTLLEVDGHVTPFSEIERRAHTAICSKLGIAPEIPPSVKKVDLNMLHTERAMLLSSEPAKWDVPGEAYTFDIIRCWSPAEAARKFLERYAQLKEEA